MYIHYKKLSFIISLILHVIMGSVSLGSLFCSCWVSNLCAKEFFVHDVYVHVFSYTIGILATVVKVFIFVKGLY